MRAARLLLWLTVGLDLLGVLIGALLVFPWLGGGSVAALPLPVLGFALLFLLLAWFLGGYSFLQWPWMPYRQLAQRWLFVVGAALLLAIWLDLSVVLVLGLVLACWGLIMRGWLQPLAQRQANRRLARSPVVRRRSVLQLRPVETDPGSSRELLLMLVAYHPSPLEVEQLQACLADLPPEVGYAVVVNDHKPGEAVEQLAQGADCFLTNSDNPGYGRAVNRLVVRLGQLPPYIAVLNTDLSWAPGTFEQLLTWLQQRPEVSLAVPQIRDETGQFQQLCKQNPTLLGLFSRRFVPDWFKPHWLKRYDHWYVMADHNYHDVFEAPYLSGCCMLIRSDAFRRAGGFDERYFLYLEDADLTRSLAREGRCVHLPVADVVHGWGRGNYRNLGLMVVNLASAWHYFRKWGWAIW
jgi:GT2 family glycosyltransferase